MADVLAGLSELPITPREWPQQSFSDVQIAKYQRAIDQGKIPSDPVYAAHVRHSRFVPDLEFTKAELSNRTVKVYKQPNAIAPDHRIPNWAECGDSTESYIRSFDTLNSFKHVEYVQQEQSQIAA